MFSVSFNSAAPCSVGERAGFLDNLLSIGIVALPNHTIAGCRLCVLPHRRSCSIYLPALSGWPVWAGPFFLLGNSVDLCIPFFVVPPVEFNRGKLHHPARSPSRARGPVCFLSVGCPTFSICGDAHWDVAEPIPRYYPLTIWRLPLSAISTCAAIPHIPTSRYPTTMQVAL